MNAFVWWFAPIAFVLGGVFASVHKSLRTASRGKLKKTAIAKNMESRAENFLEHRADYTYATSVVHVVCEVAGVAALTVWALGGDTAPGDRWLVLVAVAAVCAVVVYLTQAVIPMSVAEHAGEGLIIRAVPLLRVLRVVLMPLLAVARFSDEVIRRLSGAPELSEEEELEEEIMSVVSDRSDDGTLDESGRDMIEAVVDFRTSTIEEIMTPRTEIEGVELSSDLTAVRDFIAQAGHSRIPVYEENLDNIVGLLYAKDLLGFLGKDAAAFRIQEVMREARFVPETKHLDELLTEFQREKVHMAIVLDEYGGTAGLVTIEDVIEEIVGEIHDEYEPETDTLPEICLLVEDRAAVIEGRAYIDDVNDQLDAIGAELPEHEDYDTVGGYVTSSLGHIPVAGESFRHNGFLITVLEAEPTRVTKVRFEMIDEPDDENDRPVPVHSPAEDEPGSAADTGSAGS